MKFKFLFSVFFLVIVSTASHATLSQNEKDLKGVWFNQSTSGQGVIADVLESSGGNTIFMSWYTYTADGQKKLWLVFQKQSTLQQASSQTVDLFVAKDRGEHDQLPRFNQPPVVNVQPVGTATVQLLSPTNLRIIFQFEFAFQGDPRWNVANGEMNLTKFIGSNTPLTQNEKNLIGTWYNQQTAGQGIQSSIIPGANAHTLFIPLYTYSNVNNSNEKLWLVLQGQTTPNSTSHVVGLYVAKNRSEDNQLPRFNQPPAINVQPVGTATVQLLSPTNLQIILQFDPAFQNDPRWASSPLTMDLTRIGDAPDTTVVTNNVINTQDRNAVLDAYRTRYLAPIPALGWTGNTTSCVAGTTSLQFQQRTIEQVNYFRGMAGLQAVRLSTSNSQYQEAALIVSANNNLSHSPDPSWRCYSQSGADGSATSNLWLKATGQTTVNSTAVDSYIDDSGNNQAVGHRRWILYPAQAAMATGDTPNSNSLGIFIEFGTNTSAKEYVAWPPDGYIPSAVMPSVSKRWSLTVPGANFSQVFISMRNITTGQTYSVNPEPISEGYGDNTFVWIPNSFNYSPPAQDQNIEVTVSNVFVNGVAKTYRYNVKMISAN